MRTGRARLPLALGAILLAALIGVPFASAGTVGGRLRPALTAAATNHDGATLAARGLVHAKHSIPPSVSSERAAEPVPAVPRNFLGLSFEVGSLATIASYASSGDLVTMLRS